MLFDLELIKKVYQGFEKNYQTLKEKFPRPLTLTEKIFYSILT